MAAGGEGDLLAVGERDLLARGDRDFDLVRAAASAEARRVGSAVSDIVPSTKEIKVDRSTVRVLHSNESGKRNKKNMRD